MGEFKIDNPHEIHKSDFDEMLTLGDFEVFSKSQIDSYLDEMGSLLEKAEVTELEDVEKQQIEIAKAEISSFQKFAVRDDEYNLSLKYVRSRQIEWDKNPAGEILKGECGTYLNTNLNRKLERVGEKWMSSSYKEKQSGEQA